MRKLLFFSLPFAVGTFLCLYFLPGRWRVFAAVIALIAGFALSRRVPAKRGRKMIRIITAGLSAGLIWFAGYSAFFLNPAESLAGSKEQARMELLDYAEETDSGVRCKVKLIDPEMPGAAVYYGSADLLDLEPGNQIRAYVKFYSAANPAGQESAYYTAQGVYLRMYRQGKQNETVLSGGNNGAPRYLPQRLAKRLKNTAADIYGQPAAGFIAALLTGERDGLDSRASRELSEAGLTHITAVSGLHCAFLIGVLSLLTFRRQRLTALFGYPVLLLYMLAAGCAPSVVRACIMTGFVLFAPLLGRESDAPTSLAGALLLILLGNPFAVASVSLQLSFAAVAGLLIAAPGVYGAVQKFRNPVLNFCAGTVLTSLGVMAATAPLSAVYFGSLSLVSPIANVLVLWMLPVLFAAALFITALCAFLPGFAPLAAVPEFLADYVLRAAGLLAKIPGHSVRFTGFVTVLWLVLVYALLFLCVLSKDRPGKYAAAVLAAAVCLFAARSLPVMNAADGDLTAAVVDVGQGLAILLHSDNYTALIDCGTLGSASGPGTAVKTAMETYGWDKLDTVALTHYHEDHAGGLEDLFDLVPVGELLVPYLFSDSGQIDLQKNVIELAGLYGIPVTSIRQLTELDLGQASLTVYPPSGLADGGNEEGMIFLCSAGDFDMLITGDLPAGMERHLARLYHPLPDIEVLVAGHHGSKYSTSEELLEAVRPEVGIISAGKNNRFGHPHVETLDRMIKAGMTVFRTDLHGNILIQVHQS